ncbi:MAG: AMP-binding protein, partial [Proteobacteria bacterium]|nr:AMP-binding protein [Pseudomonadota bacterium]
MGGPIYYAIKTWVAEDISKTEVLKPYSKENINEEKFAEMRAFRKPFIIIHVYSFYLLLIIIFLHVGAIVVTEIQEKNGLITAMIVEASVAMLACTRIGAVHSIVFGGFSPEALKDRILDSDCQVVITADEGLRGGRGVSLKGNVDKALNSCPNVHTVFVVKNTGKEQAWTAGRDVWYHEEVGKVDADCPAEEMD